MFFEYLDSKIYYEFFDKEKEMTAVFLHGWGGNHQSLLPLASAFQNYNILTLDFFGFGLSDKVKEDFNIYTYVNAVIELTKFLQLKKLCLVGHSFGGRVAIIFAGLEQSLVEKVILIDSAGLKPKFNIKKAFKKFNYKVQKYLVKKNLKSKTCLEKYGSVDYKALSSSEKVVFNRVINENLSKYLKFVKQNTLIIWGEKDKDTPLYMAKCLRKNIENSRLIILKGGSHFAYVEHKNIVIKHIKEFFG